MALSPRLQSSAPSGREPVWRRRLDSTRNSSRSPGSRASHVSPKADRSSEKLRRRRSGRFSLSPARKQPMAEFQTTRRYAFQPVHRRRRGRRPPRLPRTRRLSGRFPRFILRRTNTVQFQSAPHEKSNRTAPEEETECGLENWRRWMLGDRARYGDVQIECQLAHGHGDSGPGNITNRTS